MCASVKRFGLISRLPLLSPHTHIQPSHNKQSDRTICIPAPDWSLTRTNRRSTQHQGFILPCTCSPSDIMNMQLWVFKRRNIPFRPVCGHVSPRLWIWAGGRGEASGSGVGLNTCAEIGLTCSASGGATPHTTKATEAGRQRRWGGNTVEARHRW